MSDTMHPYPCALCGRTPAAGFASIGDEWFCHGDDDPEPTCYMQAQRPRIPCDGWVLLGGEMRRCEKPAEPGCGVAFQNLCADHSPAARASRSGAEGAQP
jgi:hypothetical protein